MYGRKISKGLVPNVMGMDLKDAVYVLENAGLNVKVLGKGTVKSQSIPNGRKIEKGAEIILELA